MLRPRSKRPNAPRRVKPPPVAAGSKQPFGAIDSAIKAAFYWVQEDYRHDQLFAALNVPVCLLSLPFWDVCIDGGSVGVPEVRYRGYQSNAYPARPLSPEATAFVWASEQLNELVTALDDLLTWFRAQVVAISGLTNA